MNRQSYVWRMRVFTLATSLLIMLILLAVVVYLANEWIVSTLATVTLLAWLAGWLVVAYQRRQVRSVALGALVAGGAYWLVALGPWFSANVGTSLLTTRLLAWAETKHPAPPPALTLAYAYVPTTTAMAPVQGNVQVSGNITYATTQILYGAPVPPATPMAANPSLQLAGQWAFVWLLATIGGGLAWLIGGRASRQRNSEEEQR